MNTRMVLVPASADDDLGGLLPEELVGAGLLRCVAKQCVPELRVEWIGGGEVFAGAALVAAVWPLAGNAEQLLVDAGEKGIPRLVIVERALELIEIRALPADRVACIGRSQARLLAALGNSCEVVGIPGLDGRVVFAEEQEPHGAKPVVVVWTADRESEERRVLLEWAASKCRSEGMTAVFVHGAHSDTLARVARADACLVTDAARLTFAMAVGVPTALVRFSTWPQTVEPAWRISAGSKIDSVIGSMLRRDPARLLFQETSLHVTLEAPTPALPRLASLVQRMAGGGARPWSSPALPPLRREQRLRHEELYVYPTWLGRDEAELTALRDRYIRFARSRTMPRLDPGSVRVAINCESRVLNVRPSHLFSLNISIENGSETALVSSGETPVHVSYHWLDGAGAVAIFDGLRSKLDVPAGCTRKVPVAVRAPQDAGIYQLDVTLVQEGVFWFDQKILNCAWRCWVMVAEAATSVEATDIVPISVYRPQ